MSGRVRVAVVGCGQIAKEHLSTLHGHAAVDLVGVCDLSPATAGYAAEQYGAKPYLDYREMYDAQRPEVVHVLTPPGSHLPIVLDALEAGAHVVCEKPVAPSAADLEVMLTAADRHGRVVMESQNARFNDQTMAIERLVGEGRIGTVTDVEVLVALDLPNSRFADENVSSPVRGLRGGAIHDYLPHLVYLALHFFGYAAFGDVQARWWNVSGSTVLMYDEMLATVAIGMGSASMRFSSHVKPDMFRLVVRGTHGSVETDMYNPYLRFETARGPAPLSPVINLVSNGVSFGANGFRNLRDKVLDRKSAYHGLDRMLDQFYASLQLGGQPPVTHQQMRRTSALVDAIVAEAHP